MPEPDMGGGELFGVRKRGEDGFYSKDSDYLYVFPEIMVKGAVFAVDPNGWILNFLKEHSSKPDLLKEVKDTLEYLMDVLHECRTAPLHEVFDESRVDPIIYQGIMMGAGAVAMRKFNRLFRERRFTDLKTRGVIEPIKTVDKAAALRMFDSMYKKVSEG